MFKVSDIIDDVYIECELVLFKINFFVVLWFELNVVIELFCVIVIDVGMKNVVI